MEESLSKLDAARRGTLLHEFAKDAITLKVPQKGKSALAKYVNDAIELGLKPEQTLVYSENCFGHADTIGFDDRILRIHDYKSGDSPTTMRQLHIYAAIFCLEYNIDPHDIHIETRIYQRGKAVVRIDRPDPSGIQAIMTTIVKFDKLIKTKQ